MKKYGDDADSFHDQGTRVEASKRWHEQNQLKKDYNYPSHPKPKSLYRPRNYDKSKSKPKSSYMSKSSYKPDYSKTYAKSNYSKKTNSQQRKNQYSYEVDEFRPTKVTTVHMSNRIKCSQCGELYNKFKYKSCPNCGEPNHYIRKQNPEKYKINSIWIYLVLFILIALIILGIIISILK